MAASVYEFLVAEKPRFLRPSALMMPSDRCG
jgi:hypothetical protein